MTYVGMGEQALKVAGIDDSLLRLSIGIEAASDLISDLGQAFDAAAEARGGR